MTKAKRLVVYSKYDGHCAYCGKPIAYKDMQVDHIKPKCQGGRDIMENLFPTCRRCNHYKRDSTLEKFRKAMSTIHERVRREYICKVAEDYGIIRIKQWDGKFYFERVNDNGSSKDE